MWINKIADIQSRNYALGFVCFKQLLQLRKSRKTCFLYFPNDTIANFDEILENSAKFVKMYQNLVKLGKIGQFLVKLGKIKQFVVKYDITW